MKSFSGHTNKADGKKNAANSHSGSSFPPAIQRKNDQEKSERDNHSESAFFQPKLNIHPANDIYEREAESVADQVVRLNDQTTSNLSIGSENSSNSSVQTKISTLSSNTTTSENQATINGEELVEKEKGEEEISGNLQQKSAFDSPTELEQNSTNEGTFFQARFESGDSKTSTPFFDRQLQGTKGGGNQMSAGVRGEMESSFGADFGAVRIHTDSKANQLNRNISAQAFTHGSDIYFRQGTYQPKRKEGKHLLAHELTHVVQQGKAQQGTVQRKASAPVKVKNQTSPSVQKLGISDALDYFADKAANIPGFTMMTFLLGFNPINMRSVDRTALNLFRAIIGFMPGGELIFQALQNHGILDDIANWAQEKLEIFSDIGTQIKNGIDDFLDSLSWRDIFDLGGVWRRAKRIFTVPIGRLIDFIVGLVVDILKFIKDAILKPLAALAEGTDGYDLLKGVLGEDPITNEPYPPSPENLIGGFMKLIGQEEVWNNIQKSGAIPKAWAWFLNAMATVKAFVMQIPGLFIKALESLEIMDVVLVPRAFAKIVGVFGGFIVEFISWAGSAVWELLKIIFSVVAPGVMPYIEKAGAAFNTILENPMGFLGNLIQAGKQGFNKFAGNFLNHLKDAIINWLTGTLEGAGVYIPASLEFPELLKFGLSVLGLTWENLRVKLVKAIGEPAVKVLEEGFELVKTLVVEGPAAAWEQFLEKLSDLQSMVIGEIISFVTEKIVNFAIEKILSMLSPVGAFIQAIMGIYKTITFLVNKLTQIARVVATIIDSIAAIAAGNIAPAAQKVESTLKGMLVIAVNFLAHYAGLGKVSDAIKNVLNKVRNPIDQAMDKVIEWIMSKGKSFLKKKDDDKHGQIATQAAADLKQGGEDSGSYEVLRALKESQAKQVEQKYQGQLESGIKITISFLSPTEDQADEDLDFKVIIAPNTTTLPEHINNKSGITSISIKRSSFRVSTKWTLLEENPDQHKSIIKGRGPRLEKQLDRRHIISSQSMAAHYESALNGLKWSEAKEKLAPKKPVEEPLGNENIQKAAQALHRDFFNDVENLFIGDASENRSIGSANDIPDDWVDKRWEEHKTYIKANYALDDTFSV